MTVGISLPNRDRLWCRSRPLILGMSKSTTRQPARLHSGERKNSSPDENAWAANPIERIKTLIAFPTASSSSTMATIGPLFGTWFDRQPQDSRATDVAREALLIQPRRNCCVLRLYDCIGPQRLASDGPPFRGPYSKLRQIHRPSFRLASVGSKEPLRLCAGGVR